jgi:hypothetical protein
MGMPCSGRAPATLAHTPTADSGALASSTLPPVRSCARQSAHNRHCMERGDAAEHASMQWPSACCTMPPHAGAGAARQARVC